MWKQEQNLFYVCPMAVKYFHLPEEVTIHHFLFQLSQHFDLHISQQEDLMEQYQDYQLAPTIQLRPFNAEETCLAMLTQNSV